MTNRFCAFLARDLAWDTHQSYSKRSASQFRPAAHRSKMLRQEIWVCSEGPRTGVEYDARNPSMTEVLGVLRIATRAL